jgi:alkylhydroperoxidase family enzyme
MRSSVPAHDITRSVLVGHEDVVEALDRTWEAAWSTPTVDPRLLELCRLRIATLLGCEYELESRTRVAAVAGFDEALAKELAAWPTSPRFRPIERACLAFVEQFVIDVATLDDDLAEALRSHLGDQGVVDLTAAVLVIEQRQRLRLVWERLGLTVDGSSADSEEAS